MATDLSFAPAVPPQREHLTRGLKYLLAERYFGHDGSLSGHATMNRDDLSFLHGIKVATQDEQIRRDVAALIDAIEKYETIDLWLEG